jgi:hypothetical protein
LCSLPLWGGGLGGREIVPNSTVPSITPPARPSDTGGLTPPARPSDTGGLTPPTRPSDTGGLTPPARPSDTGGLTPPARPWGADVTPLAILTSAGIAGANIWPDGKTFGRQRLEWLKRFLRLPNGISSHDTCVCPDPSTRFVASPRRAQTRSPRTRSKTTLLRATPDCR